LAGRLASMRMRSFSEGQAIASSLLFRLLFSTTAIAP
jgi:hypothetical protein